MTVNGWIDAANMGMTLSHEHVFADLRPYEEQAEAPLIIDEDEATAVVLPYLNRIRELGVKTLIECTATGLGRNPALIQRLSAESGLHMLTTTGAYLAADGRFIAPHLREESAQTLADRWIGEWENGIGDTGVRPGLIKLGVNGGMLNGLEAKIIEAAAKTHLATGLTIATHIGPWRSVEPGHNAAAAFDAITRLQKAGVAPSAFVWIHAQNDSLAEVSIRAAKAGAFISFDGFRPGAEPDYAAALGRFKKEGLLNQVLVSQDAGWYTAGEPGGGDFSPYDPILTSLIPALREAGHGEDDLEALFVGNPARAFAVKVRSA